MYSLKKDQAKSEVIFSYPYSVPIQTSTLLEVFLQNVKDVMLQNVYKLMLLSAVTIQCQITSLYTSLSCQLSAHFALHLPTLLLLCHDCC